MQKDFDLYIPTKKIQSIMSALAKELRTLLLQSIPQVLATNGDMNLSDIFEQDISGSLVEID
jgi:hypothetical protein